MDDPGVKEQINLLLEDHVLPSPCCQREMEDWTRLALTMVNKVPGHSIAAACLEVG